MINIIVSIKDNLNNEEYRDIIRKIMNIKGIINLDCYEEKSNSNKLMDELAKDLYKLQIKHLKEKIERRDKTIERLKGDKL